MSTLPILYQDSRIVAVDKPSGLLVHPSAEASDRKTCLSVLRDQLGQYVYPLHRLDRGTSGVLLMGLDSETARAMQQEFIHRRVNKTYLAIVRGWLQGEGVLDRPLRKNGEEKESAITHYRTLAQGRLPFQVGNYPEARYSLVKVDPITGRRHQIRRHLSNASYPIVGDAVHGDGQHNRLFRRLFSCYHLLLHASSIEFHHPFEEKIVALRTAPHEDFSEICTRMGWEEWIGSGEEKVSQ